jgi:plastocyanin
MIRISYLVFFLAMFFISYPAHADVEVVEGDDAKILYEKQKNSAETLSQFNKNFILNKPDGQNIEKPAEITVKKDSYLFILNKEEKIVHNVYDQTDHSWVLKKQLPSGIAGIKFTEPGVHELRCAIHPGMKITVKVEENTGETSD